MMFSLPELLADCFVSYAIGCTVTYFFCKPETAQPKRNSRGQFVKQDGTVSPKRKIAQMSELR